ncbi:MAG TPA: EAL domain-containing protein [Longimicrobiales bacterium]|nr:EAL domain-containing protein [Longimicrobiales bacterium]
MTLAAAMLAMLVRPRLPGHARDDAADSLKVVPELSGTVYCLVGEDGRVRAVTPNAREVLGEACERAATLSLTLTELLQPEQPTDLEDWLGRAWLPEPPEPVSLETRGPDAGPRWLELSSSGRLVVGAGETVLIEIRQITTRALRDRHNRLLAHAVESATDAIYITDEAGRLTYMNGAFERLSGYDSSEILGRPASVLASGRHRPDYFARMWGRLRADETFSGEMINRRGDGSLYSVDLTITPLHEAGRAAVQYMAVARDVTDRKRIERELEDLAYYDALTGLANHRLLRERSRQILALARRHGSVAALLHVDLDRLSFVNAQYGRNVGDDVLRTVAERLRQSLRDSDTLARIGSDEFLVLLSEVADTESVARVVRRLHESVTRPFRMQELSINLNARIGVALYPQDASTYDDLLGCAEAALRRAEQSTTSFEFFEHDVSVASHDRMLLEDDMHWAWEHEQFILHYQPIIGADGRMVGAEALARGDVIGVEALARWPHLERGMLRPAQFIPLAERTGRILSLDRWAIATAARQAAQWVQDGWDGWISVNLSARTLHDPELPAYVARVLAAQNLEASRLVVEITESTAMRDPAVTAHVLEALREIGVLIAVDDFGVGHSSLAYLKLFPVDLLKLDASFVRDIGSGGREEQLIEIMVLLAHRIGAKVVAEGVETDEQMEYLRKAGCDYIQGYLVGRPAPPETMPR